MSLGPLTKEAVLEMASLTGDFSPVELVDRLAEKGGYAVSVLHPMWISGLVEVAVRKWMPGFSVEHLCIEHRCRALYTDKLTVILSKNEVDAGTEQVNVRFTIRNEKNAIRANGSVGLFSRTRAYPEDVPRETSGVLSE